ncbi:hypothetical protein PF003_g9052 [Phytophthora fragariae]|nr:hypothetical protein PF003_g9052 [Phytophthora fragariae]
MSSATSTSSSRPAPPQDAGGDHAASLDCDQASFDTASLDAEGNKPPASSSGGDKESAGAAT